MIKQILYLLLLFGWSQIGLSQSIDSSQWRIDLALTGSYQSGNFDRLQLLNRADIQWKSKNTRWEISSNHLYIFQKVRGIDIQNDYLTRNFLTYYLNPKWDVFGAYFNEKFLIKRIKSNPQLGFGTRYAFAKNQNVFFQLGLMFSYAEKTYSSNQFIDFSNGGSSVIDGYFITPVVKTRVNIIPKRLMLQTLFWYQRDINNSQNVRSMLDAALIAPIWQNLNIRVSINHYYENINVEFAEDSDLFLTYGISYQFQ
jgi:hypothetical protein